MLTINIELKDHNCIKEFFHKIHSRLENIMFSIILKLPDKFIPYCLMNWLEKYLDKRIDELNQENIKMTWKNMYLQNVVDDIQKSK